MRKEHMIPMSKQTMWNISTKAVVEYLQKSGYHVDSANANCATYPNIVAIKDNKLYGIIIDANEVRKQPKYSIGRTFDMLRFARRFNAIPLYASVGLGAANSDTFDKELLLENDPDGYLINFVDFDEINYDIVNKISDEEKKEYIINLFGDCYERCDFSLLEKYIAKDCKWFSYFSGNELNTKKEVLNYYNEKAKAMKNTKINYFLIKFVGDWFEIRVKELEMPDGTKQKNAKVKIPQPNGEIGIVLEQINDNGEKVGMSVIIGFNEKYQINDIYIGDPFAMNFEDFYDYTS